MSEIVDSTTEGIVGHRRRLTRVVAQVDTAAAFGNTGIAVLGTPRLVAWFEDASAEACAPYLPEGHHSVGTMVEVHHLRATPLGGSVEIEAEIVDYDGRTVDFVLMAWRGRTLIGRGRHTRAIIDPVRFHRRALQVHDAEA